MAASVQVSTNARWVVAQALVSATQCYPDLVPCSNFPTGDLDLREARLAMVIHRTVLQRWITLEYLLDLDLNKPMRQLEPSLQAVLLSAAAQLLFLDRVPAHAVVDESVKIARSQVRSGAAGLVNAVLRRLSDRIRSTVGNPWVPKREWIPSGNGSVALCEQLLPPPEDFVEHMRVATSHPSFLIKRWVQNFGRDRTTEICLHNVATPPTLIALESPESVISDGDEGCLIRPHKIPGFVLWQGRRDQLVQVLQQHPARRVQDPASAGPVQATGKLSVKWCLDYCAGRGTKTRQLLAMHPQARVIATDVSTDRLADLRETFVEHPMVSVVEIDSVSEACPTTGIDLLILDVPCTNTAVLARRPEAKYRFGEESLQDLVQLQRRIIELAVPLLRRGGHLLYSTCSLEQQENQDQAQWIAGRFQAQLVDQKQTLPEGTDAAYHDGSYHALLKLK